MNVSIPLHVRVALVGWIFSAMLLALLGLSGIVQTYDLTRHLP